MTRRPYFQQSTANRDGPDQRGDSNITVAPAIETSPLTHPRPSPTIIEHCQLIVAPRRMELGDEEDRVATTKEGVACGSFSLLQRSW